MSEKTTTSPPADDSVEPSLAERLAHYRQAREQIERSLLPLATSVDGRRFRFQSSLHRLALRTGGYVVLASEGRTLLGQITDLDIDSTMAADEGLVGTVSSILVRLARGTGVVLDPDGAPFHDAVIGPASPTEVGEWFARRQPARAGLTIGELLYARGVPATLDSGGLNRHTFMCGQSGSGKTYSLGVLLERVLSETSLRMVILDPNSDYVGLARLREGPDPDLAARYARVLDEVAVWRNDPEATHPLRLRFIDLDSAAQAAILGLDPIRDREEYAVLTALLRTEDHGRRLITHLDQLGTESPEAHQLGMRAANLGVVDWAVWSPEHRSLVEELRHPTARCLVVDLGSLDTVQEQRLVAQAVLSTLWGSRMARRPCLVVVDEAHNICPADPPDPVTGLVTDNAIQIAAEGRKYGLYMLTSTQRPHKVHENVVSQCDNLLLMRMNSEADVADLNRLFSFVPIGLMTGATSFGMGQALVAGKFFPQAAYVQMGERVSQEGGADVPTTWAEPRP